MVVYGPKAGKSPSLEISCIAERACYAAYIDCKDCHTTTITCYGDYACGYQTILWGNTYGYLYCSAGDSVCGYSHWLGNDLTQMQLDCGTSSGAASTGSGTANCRYAWGEFNNSNVIINCDSQWDCYSAYWSLDEESAATFDCTGDYSCRDINIFAYDATSIDIECNGRSACLYGNIQCPSLEEDSCKISCDGGDYACRFIDFYASQNWILQYLDITCDTKFYTDVCDGMKLTCEFDTGSPALDILYDSSGASCDPNNYIDCCPFNTYSPTPRPTPNPTTVPTNEPSGSPSNIPSVTPTKSPTDEPTDSTESPTTAEPTTSSPTEAPITHAPTTNEPTTNSPTTSAPTTAQPTQSPEEGEEESDGSIQHGQHLLNVLLSLLMYGYII